MEQWQSMRSGERNGGSVLERAFRLLNAFGPQNSNLSLAELSRRSELPKTTVFRLAAQLVEVGALERSGDTYRLGLWLFEIGSSVTRQRRLREAALPLMQDLYEATHETVHLGVLNGIDVLYIEKIAGRRVSSVATRVGTKKPLYCTALGKAILSLSPPAVVNAVLEAGLAQRVPRTISTPEALLRELKTVRKTGLAHDREEYAIGITCVASPLIEKDGTAYAALSVTGPTQRFDPERVGPAVRTAALTLSRMLDGLPWGHE